LILDTQTTRTDYDSPWKVKLLDYGQDRLALEENLNPFAVVVLAHLQTIATSPKAIARRDAKFRLTRLLYERNYTRKKIVELLRFIDWIMVLTLALEAEFAQAVDEYEEQYKMKYVTTFERRGKEKGRQIGLEEGIEQSIVNILIRRFGEVTELLQEKIEQASLSQLELLVVEAAVTPDLETFIDFVDETLS
jgi:flagellar biosynthesis/type III secretory pathway protein FliH